MTACPKTKNYRDRHLLDMYRGQLCFLRVHGGWSHDPATVVGCHSNSYTHGKGKSLKAHDFFTVGGCASCHAWLDAGSASRGDKDSAFDAAHKLQVEDWEHIRDADEAYPKDRKSAGDAVAAFREWVTDNKWRFTPGDWQLNYLIKEIEHV